MKLEVLQDCIAEAERFIKVARKLGESVDCRRLRDIGTDTPKESGAVRRASMDLTRRLADLRQGRD